jgi:hypothetical protein
LHNNELDTKFFLMSVTCNTLLRVRSFKDVILVWPFQHLIHWRLISSHLISNVPINYFLTNFPMKIAPYMQVSEALTSTDCKNIVIPCRKNKNNGLQLFMRTLQEIDTTTRVLFPPYQVLAFNFSCFIFVFKVGFFRV